MNLTNLDIITAAKPDQMLIVAVSGGVDSAVLLHLTAQKVECARLIVAHFDHAMRDDSADDARFVEGLAQRYRLGFASERSKVQLKSETEARQARYDFLNRIAKANNNARLVTAHHLDDALETTAFNLNRGTGIKGAINMLVTGKVIRPLINYTKQQVIDYAIETKLEWTQDSTNTDLRYSRNRLRSRLRLISDDDRRRIVHILSKLLGNYNQQLFIMTILKQFIDYQPGWSISRQSFAQLDSTTRESIMHHLLSEVAADNIERHHIIRMADFASTADNGKIYQLSGSQQLRITRERIIFESR